MRRKPPELYTRAHSSHIWLRYYDEDGRLIRRSSGTAEEAEARQVLEQAVHEVEAKKAARAGIEKLEVRFSVAATKQIGTSQESDELGIVQVINANDDQAVDRFADLARDKVLDLLLQSKF